MPARRQRGNPAESSRRPAWLGEGESDGSLHGFCTASDGNLPGSDIPAALSTPIVRPWNSIDPHRPPAAPASRPVSRAASQAKAGGWRASTPRPPCRRRRPHGPDTASDPGWETRHDRHRRRWLSSIAQPRRSRLATAHTGAWSDRRGRRPAVRPAARHRLVPDGVSVGRGHRRHPSIERKGARLRQKGGVAVPCLAAADRERVVSIAHHCGDRSRRIRAVLFGTAARWYFADGGPARCLLRRGPVSMDGRYHRAARTAQEDRW